MKVTDIARRAGIGPHTVRYYVRAGLLEPRRDPVNNYKQFGEEHIARLHFIKGAQALGFSLSDVLGLLQRMDHGECPCSAMQAQLADKILEARTRMEALAQRLAFMQRVYTGWDADPGGKHDVGALCRLLEEQAAPGGLPPDPGAPPVAKAVLNAPGTVGDASARGPHSASAPRTSAAFGPGTAAALRFLQSEWNSPASR